MGRRYYCDFCEKSMANNPSAIKTHNEGLQHTKLKKEHYQKFKSIETILEEESKKIPCSRFQSGIECHFGMNCRFSHYTKHELENMRYYLYQKNNAVVPNLHAWFLSRRRRNLTDSKCLKKIFLKEFQNNVDINEVMSWRRPVDNIPEHLLPPSVRKVMLNDFDENVVEKWG